MRHLHQQKLKLRISPPRSQKTVFQRPLTFIDLFSGCGGLSLGLLSAGLKGLFAIEKSKDAFSTLAHNLVHGRGLTFDWPRWLPVGEMSISELLAFYQNELLGLRGQVDILAGGPPCQGFSTAGRRDAKDQRNTLTDHYIEVVKLVQPQFLLLENVSGFAKRFVKRANEEEEGFSSLPYSEVVIRELKKLEYQVFTKILCCSMAGVPQKRKRYILLAVRNQAQLTVKDPFQMLEGFIPVFRELKGLPGLNEITASEAISDLEVSGKKLIDCVDTDQPGFKQIEYEEPENLTLYQQLMRKGMFEQPNSLRLPRHKPETITRFETIQENVPAGSRLKKHQRGLFGTKKHVIAVLSQAKPSATVTTLPDDILHYSEPRILTVRENARLQSFPDWFEFKGKYTTGGNRRRQECPRYTQVGNAVPPLLAELLGRLLVNIGRAK